MGQFKRHLWIALTFASAILAQNPNSAAFPAGIAADSDLFVATNGGSTTLNGAINNSTTSVVLTSGTNFVAPVVILIESEILHCTTLTTNTLSGCTRGSEGTSAVSHADTTRVQNIVSAWHHNQSAAEIKAIETLVGKTSLISVANAGSTGTTTSTLTKLTGAPSTAVVAGTTDTNGVVGITTSGAGTAGSAVIQTSGLVSCIFSNATTAGHYVQISGATAGRCADTGSASFPSSGGQVIGRVLSTNGSAGTYTIDLFTPEIQAVAGALPAPAQIQACGNGGGSGISSITCTFGSAVTAGSHILVCVNDQNGNTITWSGDGGTFSSNQSFATGGGWTARCNLVNSAVGGGTTITATASLNWPTIVAIEFTATGIDRSDSGATATGTSASSGSVTTVQANELAIGLIVSQAGGTTITPTNSFTNVTNAFGNSGNNVSLNLIYRSLTLTTTLAATATVGSAAWGAYIITFY